MQPTKPFIKLMRSDAAEGLLRYPNCFTVLSLIALRARREAPAFNPFGLVPGEAMVGDFAAVGLTRQEFRTAVSNLQKWGFITTRTTNKGTVAKLSISNVYDINSEPPNQQANPSTTSEQPVSNQPVTTNKKDKKERKKEVAPLRSERGGNEPAHFAAFWQAYPRKESRATALKAFEKLSQLEQAAAPRAAAEWFGRRLDWIGPNGQDFRPHPATWLNQKRWNDLTEINIIPLNTNGHEQPLNPQRNAVNPSLVNDQKRAAAFAILDELGL